ncbi:AraC-type DNA-binding protein [Flavobacterium resistens]|uniref:AraC-type DNA-binding protein n=1 Tax=Flavobacterium resistens TaxID=443612 RepID=A0A521BBC4_9FLAO|nr:helix-turn-helix transcriptional regulator [Flavobacterium resistens]MRX67186.1 helix-turn-helix domain-containing protein [Flavobacterium resistens]SMO44040.1 AraC-type DNA-binding protein [Flavobacterium resistens]
MDIGSLLSVLSGMSVFVSLLLAFFLFTVKTENKLANRLFAFYLIFFAIDNVGIFINEDFIKNHFNLEFFRWSTCALIIPAFYLYIISVCFTDFRLQAKHLLHAIPFLITNGVFLLRLYFLNNAEKLQFYDHRNQMPELYGFQLMLSIQIVFYSITVFLVLKKYKELYQENYANPKTSIFKWLFQISIVLFILYYLSIAKNVLRYIDLEVLWIWANVIMQVFVLTITCWFVLKALNHPELFRGIDSKLQLARDIVHEDESIVEVKDNQSEEVIAKIAVLKQYMTEKEPFLDPSLTIQELSNQIDIPVRDLSILINHHIDQHFFDFVNEYRIQKAMSILKNPLKSDLTVLEILYEVGFNSKSSFNTYFKKYTNLTPTAFRNAS